MFRKYTQTLKKRWSHTDRRINSNVTDSVSSYKVEVVEKCSSEKESI